MELDAAGRLCALTIEHASTRMEISAFSYEEIPGGPVSSAEALPR
ncbi:MAG: hypothetical protein OXI54_07620 [Chloroflexota bacterium]|nr:hypothetical protein [Chloroflexota bacterium]MDE2684001.1 hypothetical protein [Chloroflexota bacterium]